MILLLVMCPRGDDPITINQNKFKFLLTIDSSATLSGELIVHFQEDRIHFLIDADFNNNTCRNAFLSSRKIKNVTCNFQRISSTLSTMRVTVLSWPLFPQQNNIYTHDGTPPMTDFTCDTTKMSSSVDCTFTPIFTSNIEGWFSLLSLLILVEYDYCSNRGICDFTIGDCICFPGFGGVACNEWIDPSLNQPGVYGKVSREVRSSYYFHRSFYID